MTTGRVFTSGTGGGAPSLLDYVHVLWRRKWIFLATCLLVPAAALTLSLRQEPLYEASADVLLKPPTASTVGGVQQGNIDPARFAETQTLLARVPDVAEMALARVPGTGLTVDEFLKASSVAATPGSDLLTFAVKNSSPRQATALATAYARAFTKYKADQDLKPFRDRLDDVRARLAELERTGDTRSAEYRSRVQDERELEGTLAFPVQSAEVVRLADKAEKVAPRPVRNGGIGFVLGVILALGAAFLVEALDTRVRSVDAVRDTLGIPVLGQLPPPPRALAKQGKLVMLADPVSLEAEGFRTLRANLAFANARHNAHVLMVTSALDEEGKSTTVANLAVALARAGRRVILIDGDLRSPRLHQLFGLQERPGLTDIELGDAGLDDALREVDFADTSERSRAGTLKVLPAGHALHDPDELGAETAVARVVRELRGRADFVLVDAAPLLPVGDAVALSAHVDGILLVVRLESLRWATLDELARILSEAPAATLGIIVTGAPAAGALQYRRYGPPPGARAIDPVLQWTAPPKESAGEIDGGSERPHARRLS